MDEQSDESCEGIVMSSYINAQIGPYMHTLVLIWTITESSTDPPAEPPAYTQLGIGRWLGRWVAVTNYSPVAACRSH